MILPSFSIQQDNRIKKILKVVNKDLKEIAGLLNINDDLTFYSSRHTFATVSKKAGVPTAIISEALGHDTERTTNIYLDALIRKIWIMHLKEFFEKLHARNKNIIIYQAFV